MSRKRNGKEAGAWAGPLPERAGLEVASQTLRVMSNPVRLEILCHLLMEGELGVGALQEQVGLSQSALSQHLGKLRGMGMVETRRDRQRIFYRIGRPDVQRVMDLMRDLYCREGMKKKGGKTERGAGGRVLERQASKQQQQRRDCDL